MPHTIEHYNIGLLSELSKYVNIYSSYKLKDSFIYNVISKMKGKRYFLKSYDYLYALYVDVIHANSFFHADPIWKIKKGVLVTAHSFPLPQIEILPRLKRFYIREAYLMRKLYKNNIPIIAISRFTARMLEYLYGVRCEKVIYHGVRNIFFLERRYNDTSGRINLIYISKLHPIKEPMLLLKAIKKVVKEYPDIRLFIRGNGPLLYKVCDFCRREKIAENVKVLYEKIPLDMLMKLYRISHIFVHTSRYEPFGLVVVEAMASGLPVIVPRMGGAYEVAGNAGISFYPGDPDDLSEKILKVIYDEKLRYIKSRESVRRAKEFTWKKSAEEYIKFYIDLIS